MSPTIPMSATVERLPIAALKTDPRNPRQHSDRQVRQIARSIASFGFNVPILIDRDNRILAGHGRLQACQQLGLTDVAIIRLEHLSKAQASAFSIAENRLSETSSWDDRLLAEVLKDLADLDLDFSIEATGFDMGEIDFRIEALSRGADESEDRADALPSTLGPCITRSGDLWLLGNHRVFCGSALDIHAYETLMGPNRAEMVFTDPPYNVRIDGHVSGLGSVHHREFAMASGEMSKSEFTSFLTLACTLLARHSTDGSIHFVCMDWRHADDLMAAGKLAYSDLKNICVWNKHNGGMGSFYRSQHELIFVFKSGHAAHRNNIQLGQHGRNRSNVWSYPGANSFGRETEEGLLSNLHPTVKPVRLVADAILDCSSRGAVVLDPFLGSGTTMIAAERTGRRCFGMEIDTHYVDTIVRRWQAYTGEAAKHALTREPFNRSAMEANNGK